MVDLNDGLEILSKFRQRLLDIKNRLLEIEARFEYLGAAVERRVTLREFTEKQLNAKGPKRSRSQFFKPQSSSQEIFKGLTLHPPVASHLSWMGASRHILRPELQHRKPLKNYL